jgi:hypothetical protein
MKIIVREVWGGFHATLHREVDERPCGAFGSGATPEQAVGDLLINRVSWLGPWDRLGLPIVEVATQTPAAGGGR